MKLKFSYFILFKAYKRLKKSVDLTNLADFRVIEQS